MKNIFPIIIISEFFTASAVCFFCGYHVKGYFYLLSGLINLTVIFM